MKKLLLCLLCALLSGGCLDVLKGDDGERGPQGEKGPQGEQGEKGDQGDAGATIDVLRHVIQADEVEYSYSTDRYHVAIQDEFFETDCSYSYWLDYEQYMINLDGKSGSIFLCMISGDNVPMMQFHSLFDLTGETLFIIKTKPTETE